MSSASEFFVCYAYFAELNVVKTVLELLLIVAAVGFNVLCTYLILFKSISWSVFDQILIGHCFIQCITALIDVPFFHMQDIFGYWPLPKIFSYFWASYDNNINTTTNLNMLYMCWARYRSVAAPTTFKNEVLIKHPKIVLTSIWGIGLTIWTPITIRYNNLNFSSSLNYDPIYLQNIFNTLFWFVPLILILYYSIQIIWILNKRALKKLLLIKHAVGDTTAHTPHTVNTVNSTTMTSPPVVGGKRNFAKRLSVIVKKKAKKVKMPPQVRFLLISEILKLDFLIHLLLI
jgi:hypothetical protein